MSKIRSSHTSPLTLALRKLLVSGFVVFSFIAYIVHDGLVNADPRNGDAAFANQSAQAQLMTASPQVLPTVQQVVPTSEQLAPTLQSLAQSSSEQSVLPSNTPFVPTQTPLQPTVTEQPQGQYLDGVYTGPVINAFYGLVQVQATVRNGALADVQFLRYPNDRRTSQRINSIAMPRLTQEAVQVQSAFVHIVSGATLTSEAFAQSLYTALNEAAL